GGSPVAIVSGSISHTWHGTPAMVSTSLSGRKYVPRTWSITTMCGFASSGGRVTSMVSIAFGRASSASPISLQSRGAHAPAATTTAPASMRPDGVSTPVTALSRLLMRVTGVHWRIWAPRACACRRKPSTTSAGLAEPRIARPRQARVLDVGVVHAHERARAARCAAGQGALLEEDHALDAG